MGAVALVALLAGGPLGMCLAIAYGITHFVKVAKVDAEYAKQGKTPPSHALISRWLDSRAKKGAKPQKPAKYGMWRYAWQRWQAMWEDLTNKHREVRDQYKTAVEQAKARGEQPPPKPTLKETLTGWQWQLDQLDPPTPADATSAGDTPQPATDTRPRPRPRPAGPTGPTVLTDGTVQPGTGWPTTGTCGHCHLPRRLTAVGWCEPCLLAGEHGFCSRCNGLMIRDGDVYRHGPHQGCDAVAPAEEPAAAPTPPTSQPAGLPGNGTPDQQGDTMTAAAQSGEVTGIPSAVHYMTQVAATHTQHGGNEQIITAMHNMSIGGGDIALVEQAKEASMNAATLWETAGTTIEQHNAGVREGYGSAPDAADKHAQIAE